MSLNRHGALAAAALACLLACGRDREPREDDEQATLPEPASATMDARAGRRRASRSAARDSVREIADAPNDDPDYAGTEPLEVVRLVYRVDLFIPAMFGERPTTMPVATAELHVDVSEDRLRARFAGPGWPVAAGSEVRLRRDRGGVYIFDASGGHPLGVGMLAAWFQGGPLSQNGPPSIAVRRAPPVEQTVPGDLLCALIAEWSSQPRDEIERRCGEGGAPVSFRVGPWRAERTAEVPVHLPRESMRADEEGPPLLVPATETSRAFMEPTVLALVPAGARRSTTEAPPTDVAEGLRVVNAGPTRVIVLASGVPVGWVDASATATFIGLRRGEHLIAAMRPLLGNPAIGPRSVVVPGEVRIGRRRAGP